MLFATYNDDSDRLNRSPLPLPAIRKPPKDRVFDSNVTLDLLAGTPHPQPLPYLVINVSFSNCVPLVSPRRALRATHACIAIRQCICAF
jgi:hypothetical protein